MGRMKMQVRKNQVPGGGKCKYRKIKYVCARWKMQVRKNEVEMLAQVSTDGTTIDGSQCETDITKHPKNM